MYRGLGKNQVVGNPLIKTIAREDLEKML